MAVYLDCAATSPIEPEVRDAVLRFMVEDFGNAGSRTHEYGARAQQAVQAARDDVAAIVGARRDEVVFTSGATESNNLAILGLGPWAECEGRRHVVTTAIEHKAVLEPIDALQRRGFEVTLVAPSAGGRVEPEAVRGALRRDTCLVSVMHVNNETGVVQPVEEIAAALGEHGAYLHVDAAQSFGKLLAPLRSSRIDMVSVSGHKIYGPKGIGALILRRRGFERVPLAPLAYGGGQERGLRPGTLPVPLVVGLGVAVRLACKNVDERAGACWRFRERALNALAPLDPTFHGDQSRVVPHILNLSFARIDSEALMVAWKDLIAVSNGSACTSQSYEPSHVLRAMSLPDDAVQGAVRLSWCHMTDEPDWSAVVDAVRRLR